LNSGRQLISDVFRVTFVLLKLVAQEVAGIARWAEFKCILCSRCVCVCCGFSFPW